MKIYYVLLARQIEHHSTYSRLVLQNSLTKSISIKLSIQIYINECLFMGEVSKMAIKQQSKISIRTATSVSKLYNLITHNKTTIIIIKIKST